MAKVSRFSKVRAVTAELVVEYLKFVPVDEDLVVEARELEKNGRVIHRVGEIRNRAGEVLARGRGRFIEIDASHAPARKATEQGPREARSPS